MGEVNADIGTAIQQSGRWLLRQQDAGDGGWAEREGKSSSTLNTAEALIALARVRDSIPYAGRQLRAAVEFLDRQQTKEGPDAGSWPRSVGGAPRCADLPRTSVVVEALAQVSKTLPMPAVELGSRWLLAEQGQDGGWGHRRGAESMILPTCFATMALLAVMEAGLEECEEAIRAALDFLAGKQSPDGSFGPHAQLKGARTAYAALCFQRAERFKLSVHGEARERAIAWLEDNPVDATREVEETIEIDPDREDPRGDYAFVFMTEELVVRLMSESPDKQRRSGYLAREAMEMLFKNMDAEGGFFGRRVFSWSTARALSALAFAQQDFSEFPTAPRPPDPRPLGHLILGFGVLVLISVVGLSALGVFGTAQAVIFMFLALVPLIGYGVISEKTFLEAIRSIVPLGRGRGGRV